jgi:hypothetical protein
MLLVMNLMDHDLLLAGLARARIDEALAEAERERRVRQAQGAPEREATTAPGGDPALTPARLETR